MLERRLLVLKGILESEEVYLRELDALLMVTHTHTHTVQFPPAVWPVCRSSLQMRFPFFLSALTQLSCLLKVK